VAGLLSTLTAEAQVRGDIVWLEYQTIRPGSKTQYEEGRAQKAKWHREKKDPMPLYVWEVISGERTGQYMVAVSTEAWAGFDNSAVSADENTEKFQELMGKYVVSVQTHFLDHLPDVSWHETEDQPPPPLAVMRVFDIEYGKWGEFYTLLRKFREAAEEGDWPRQYSWFSLNRSGPEPTFVELVGKENWAAMAPPEKSPLQLIVDLFGHQDSMATMNALGNIVKSETSQVLRFRSDLSHLPE